MIMIVTALLVAPAQAYNFYYCGSEPAAWPGASVAFSISTFLTASQRDGVEESIMAWGEEAIPGSAMGVDHGLTSVTTSGSRDGINIVAFTQLGDCELASLDVLALTDFRGRGCEGDDQFLDNDFWQVSEDDREGLRALYPDPSSTGTDVAVQVYAIDRAGHREDYCLGDNARPLPTINDLSARAVEDGLDVAECPSDKSTLAPDAPMPILAGADLDVGYALLNLGTEWVETYHWIRLVPVSGSGSAHVLYTNSRILRPDDPQVLEQTVTIPVDLEPGVYNVEIEVDYGDLLVETDESNNLAVWNLQVEGYGCSCSAGRSGAGGLSVLALSGLFVIRRRRGGPTP